MKVYNVYCLNGEINVLFFDYFSEKIYNEM